jgi:hypothetical protein
MSTGKYSSSQFNSDISSENNRPLSGLSIDLHGGFLFIKEA